MTGDQNIVLTGFMGCGKTSAGNLAAALLRRLYVDLDEQIEARTGRPIPALVELAGGAAFAAAEEAVCREMAEPRSLVASTGGFTLLHGHNRALLERSTFLVCLWCHPDELISRLEADRPRPLMQQPDWRERVRAYVGDRPDAFYPGLPRYIDTTHRTIVEVAEQIVDLWHNRDRAA